MRRPRADKILDVKIRNCNLVDVVREEIRPATIGIKDGRVAGLDVSSARARKTINARGQYLAPGFWDAHLHTESTMLLPSELAKISLVHGTTAVVTDPHEYANVLGPAGVRMVYRFSKGIALRVFITVPSCVPAAPGLDTAAAEITPEDVERLMNLPRVVGLAEVMNVPAVLSRDAAVLRMIQAAKMRGKVVDGHAPLLTGTDLEQYVRVGISSDHESVDGNEAAAKLAAGMHVMIREGSAARNLSSIVRTLVAKGDSFERCMFCTDDVTPVDLLKYGQVDYLIRRAIGEGLDPVRAYAVATVNAARYFRQNGNLGSVEPGKLADLTVLSSLEEATVRSVMVHGRTVAKGGKLVDRIRRRRVPGRALRTFRLRREVKTDDFRVKASPDTTVVTVRVIGAIDGQIVTRSEQANLYVVKDFIQPSTAQDILTIAVVERHKRTGNIGVGFVKGFGLNRGAIASSVAHDSHNIIAVGAEPTDMAVAVNIIADKGGGLAVSVRGQVLRFLSLPVAGLVSTESAPKVPKELQRVSKAALKLGCTMRQPFMTLSFQALPVIPELKITDKGLVDVRSAKHAGLVLT